VVNARKVNGRAAYFSPATFCESFAVSGRIPCFQNPFKYTRNLRINQKTVHFSPRAARARRNLCYRFNALSAAKILERYRMLYWRHEASGARRQNLREIAKDRR
jgi:hypothetical protein